MRPTFSASDGLSFAPVNASRRAVLSPIPSEPKRGQSVREAGRVMFQAGETLR